MPPKKAKGQLNHQMLSLTARMEDLQTQLEASGVAQMEDLQRQLMAQQSQMLEQRLSILQATEQVTKYRQCLEVLNGCMMRMSLGTQTITQELGLPRKTPAHIPELADLLANLGGARASSSGAQVSQLEASGERAAKQGRSSRPSIAPAAASSASLSVFTPMLRSAFPPTPPSSSGPMDVSPPSPPKALALTVGGPQVALPAKPSRPTPELALEAGPGATPDVQPEVLQEGAAPLAAPAESPAAAEPSPTRGDKAEAPRYEGPKRTGGYSEQAQHFKLIHKSAVHKCIWVGEWSPASPTKHPDWQAFFEANKTMATEEIQILEDPFFEKEEAQKLALWFKPIRWGLCNGDGVNDYAGKMFQGWMGPNTFLGLVSNRVTPPQPRRKWSRRSPSFSIRRCQIPAQK